jgi:hypothetical protein
MRKVLKQLVLSLRERAAWRQGIRGGLPSRPLNEDRGRYLAYRQDARLGRLPVGLRIFGNVREKEAREDIEGVERREEFTQLVAECSNVFWPRSRDLFPPADEVVELWMLRIQLGDDRCPMTFECQRPELECFDRDASRAAPLGLGTTLVATFTHPQ